MKNNAYMSAKNLKFSVVQAPDNRLRVSTKPVKKITSRHLETIKEMVKLTKTFKDPEGVGLASTQIGKDEQYFIAKGEKGTFIAYFNPKILKYSDKKKVYLEGCLSIPNYWGETERSVWVEVEYEDQNGAKIVKKLKGLDAHIFQHEVDHLNGVLFMDKVLERRGKLYKVIGRDEAGAEIFEEVKI